MGLYGQSDQRHYLYYSDRPVNALNEVSLRVVNDPLWLLYNVSFRDDIARRRQICIERFPKNIGDYDELNILTLRQYSFINGYIESTLYRARAIAVRACA